MENKSLQKMLSENGHTLLWLAECLGVNKSTISRWNSGKVPAERVLQVERITGISRNELRPDLYEAA